MFNSKQLNSLSSLVIDLGKILFGSGVIGFFISDINIPLETFIGALFFSVATFFIGVLILK